MIADWCWTELTTSYEKLFCLCQNYYLTYQLLRLNLLSLVQTVLSETVLEDKTMKWFIDHWTCSFVLNLKCSDLKISSQSEVHLWHCMSFYTDYLIWDLCLWYWVNYQMCCYCHTPIWEDLMWFVCVELFVCYTLILNYLKGNEIVLSCDNFKPPEREWNCVITIVVLLIEHIWRVVQLLLKWFIWNWISYVVLVNNAVIFVIVWSMLQNFANN